MVEIVDLSRVIRPQSDERRIEWRCSRDVRMRFRELLARLVALEYEDQRSREVRRETLDLQEEIRRLPGFPLNYDPDRDVIVPVTTTAQR